MTKLNADRMTYEEAIEITKHLPQNQYLLPAGSVASQQPFPQDLDFITTLNLGELYQQFSEMFPHIWLKTRLGTKRFDYYPIINGKKIVINIWRSSKEDLPFYYFAYGYPRGFSIAMKKRAKNRGFKLSQYGIFDRNTGEKLDIHTIDQIFTFLDLPFRTPREEYLKHIPKKDKEMLMRGGVDILVKEAINPNAPVVKGSILTERPKPKKLNVNPDLIRFLEQKTKGDIATQQGKAVEEREKIVVTPTEYGPPEAPPLGIPMAPGLPLGGPTPMFSSYPSGPISIKYEATRRVEELRNLKEEIELSRIICKLLAERTKRGQQELLERMEVGEDIKEKAKSLILLDEELHIFKDICKLLRREYKRKIN